MSLNSVHTVFIAVALVTAYGAAIYFRIAGSRDYTRGYEDGHRRGYRDGRVEQSFLDRVATYPNVQLSEIDVRVDPTVEQLIRQAIRRSLNEVKP